MKSKLIFGLATLAALALPAMAEDGNRFRDRDGDRDRRVVVQTYVGPRYGYDPVYVAPFDRDDYYRRAAIEARERRERMEHERFEHGRFGR